MKQRFSSLDIRAITHELSTALVSLRVSNVYDLSSRIFLLKFAKPDHRHQLVVDSGFRCHLTAFARTTAGAPSAFVARLRKFLRTRRVTRVAQVGTDRILEIQFSDGQYRLFFEFYAGGNIVLTDGELHILALLRNVSEGSEHERIRQGSEYNVSLRQNVGGVPPVSVERVRDGLQRYVDRQSAAVGDPKAKKFKKKVGGDLRKALSASINEYPPILLEHALQVSGFDASQAPEDVLKDDSLLRQVVTALEEAGRVMAEIMASDPIKGFIIGKANPSAIATPEVGTEKTTGSSPIPILYNDFHPFKPIQFANDSSATILEFDGFNKTVDEFFSSIEGQKLESRLQEREAAAQRKIQHAKQDQEKRIGGLQAVQTLNVRKAQAIEANLARVEEATAAINGLIAQGQDWVEIERLIELEQKRHNPVAEMIKLPLKLNENTATLLLGEWEEEDGESEDEGYQTDSEPSGSDSDSENEEIKKQKHVQDDKPAAQEKRLAIDIDLALSGWSNAREYYDQKKTAAAKQEKTVQASAKALKNAQSKIEADLKRGLKLEKDVLRPVRAPFWFEKFIYFISSDGYLVVGGKDAQQSDTLYRQYLKRGDAYVHADLTNAAPMIIKNNPATPDAPLPPSTLSQAGNLSVSTSVAWDSKAVMSAWWVPADQVTKVAPTGDYLGPGKVHVKGEKNFLPPAQLLLGFAVMFQISDASKARHTKHRVPVPASDEEKAVPAEASSQADQAEMNGNLDDDDDDSARSDDGAESVAASEQVDDEDRDENQLEDEDGADQVSHQYVNPLQTTTGPRPNRPDTQTTAEESPDEHPPEAQTPDPSPSPDPDSDSPTDGAGEVDDTTSQAPTTTSQKTPHPTRGQRAKRKKIATKYANQDPSDRADALRLLGSSLGAEKAAAAAAAKRAAAASAAAAQQHRKEKAERAQVEGRKREAARREEEEEGRLTGQSQEADEEDSVSRVDLETLVGRPLPGDEILAALPVCAPWSALGRYKYKVKMQPGATKKGRAVREVLGRWGALAAEGRNVDVGAGDTERIWPREAELMGAWRDVEVFGVVPVGKVRVMMAGGAKGGGGGGGGAKKGRGGKGSKKR